MEEHGDRPLGLGPHRAGGLLCSPERRKRLVWGAGVAVLAGGADVQFGARARGGPEENRFNKEDDREPHHGGAPWG